MKETFYTICRKKYGIYTNFQLSRPYIRQNVLYKLLCKLLCFTLTCTHIHSKDQHTRRDQSI